MKELKLSSWKCWTLLAWNTRKFQVVKYGNKYLKHALFFIHENLTSHKAVPRHRRNESEEWNEKFSIFPNNCNTSRRSRSCAEGILRENWWKSFIFLFEHLRELFVRRRVEHQLVQREEKTWKVAMKKFIFLLMENILFSLAILSLLAFTCVLKLFKQQIINHFIFLCATHCLPQPHHINSRRRNIVKVD